MRKKETSSCRHTREKKRNGCAENRRAPNGLGRSCLCERELAHPTIVTPASDVICFSLERAGSARKTIVLPTGLSTSDTECKGIISLAKIYVSLDLVSPYAEHNSTLTYMPTRMPARVTADRFVRAKVKCKNRYLREGMVQACGLCQRIVNDAYPPVLGTRESIYSASKCFAGLSRRAAYQARGYMESVCVCVS